MSLIFDLAEAINLGVGAVTGEATRSLKDWLAEVATQRRVSAAFRRVIEADDALESRVRQCLVELVADANIVRFLIGGTGTDGIQAWQDVLDRQPSAAVDSLHERLAQAGINAIVSPLSLPDRLLHSRIDQLQRQLAQSGMVAVGVQALQEEMVIRLGELRNQVSRLEAEVRGNGLGGVSVADRVAEYTTRVILPLTRVAFEGREAELSEMAAFASRDGSGQWWWWRAEPLAGKTTLMAWLATHPPQGVRVASVFVIGRQAADADSDAFYAYLLPQLALMAGLTQCELPHDLQGRRAQFDRLLRLAAGKATFDDEHILILVDGLDEDQGSTVSGLRGKQSVAASLPAILPPNVHVAIASRGNPPLPGDLPKDHPLQGAGGHTLVESPAAVAARDAAMPEINMILDTTDIHGAHYGRDVLAFLAASGSVLTVRDLAELTQQPFRTIERLMTEVTGRSFNITPLPDGTESYSLGHDVLDQVLTTTHLDQPVRPPAVRSPMSEEDIELERARYQRERLDALAPWRLRIAAWGQDWSLKAWPAETPAYLA